MRSVDRNSGVSTSLKSAMCGSRMSGLSIPYFRIASSYVIRGKGTVIAWSAARNAAATNRSANPTN